MKNEDNGVITMYLHGRPNLLSIFDKWVDSYFSKKCDSYIDWRKDYLKSFGINVDLMGYDDGEDWDDEDYYDAMGDWYNTHLNDDSYWNPSPSEDDDYEYDEVYPGNSSSTKRRGKNGKYKHEKSKGCKIVDMNGEPYCGGKGKKGKHSKMAVRIILLRIVVIMALRRYITMTITWIGLISSSSRISLLSRHIVR